MTASYRRTADWLAELGASGPVAAALARLAPRPGDAPTPIPWDPRVTAAGIDGRWDALALPDEVRAALFDPHTATAARCYERSIESLVGTVKIPVGIAGPIRVNGLFARGDYVLPLATTEATLVASFGRGAALVTGAGGCAAAILDEGVSRAPGFAFDTLREAALFVSWAMEELDAIRRVAEATTRHGRLIDVKFTIEGNHVFVHLELHTGDAAGQNMVTLATEAVCRHVRAHSPVTPVQVLHDANLSGEKRQNHLAFQSVRGRRVCAEVRVPAPLVERLLHTTPHAIERAYRMGAIGGVLCGAVGLHAQYANGLAALFLATGQDVACVAEAATGVTRFEVDTNGDLYASVTLPNLIVGTVGGATSLPSQAACLAILGLAGPGNVRAFAEVCAATCLAGELSVMGALAAGEFARAHTTLARRRTAGS